MLISGYMINEKYEVIKVLGRGGMGTVYLCKDIRLDKFWAIKEIKKDNKQEIDFLSEPNILRKLNHPGVPRIVDIIYEEDKIYMVEDYIEGCTLKTYVKEGRLTDTESICKVTLGICNIISYLHRLNPPIIYRDLKPSNIMITPEENVVLIDFGISKIFITEKNEDTIKLGSNGYAAPEQYGHGKCCKETDVYGAGMVLYFMTTGKMPTTPLEPLMDENYDINIDCDLVRIIKKCVQIDIRDRYSSIEELSNEIVKFIDQDMYEKTLILDNHKIKASKRDGNKALKRSFIGMLASIALIVSGLYYWDGYVNDKKYAEMADSHAVNNMVDSKPVGENNSINKPKDTAVVQEDSTNISNNIDKKNYTTRGKGKGTEKNKHKK